MRGTEFVVIEIIWWMAAAAAVGVLIGWLVRGWRNARIDAEWLILVTSLRDRIARLEGDEIGPEPADGDRPEDEGLPAHEEPLDAPGADEETETHATQEGDAGPAPEVAEDADSVDEPSEDPGAVDEPSVLVETDDRGDAEGPVAENAGNEADAHTDVVVDLTDATVGPADPFALTGGEPTDVEEDELETS